MDPVVGKAPVVLLNEMCQRKSIIAKYDYVPAGGEAHAPMFQCRLTLAYNGQTYYEGSSVVFIHDG